MTAPHAVNVLLVDDQPAKLLTYEAMLQGLDINLIKAESGTVALEQLLQHQIALVLMDVSMPGLDGFELAGIIREHPRFQKTAIIFVSAIHLTDRDQLQGYATGAVDYVSVPVIPELLRAKVGVFVELHRKTRESEELARTLERRVAERTAELEASTAKLSELAEALRIVDRRKDEFLAMLAHELRNPLAPILNAVGIMRTQAIEDARLAWCRDVIDRQARQLTRLVGDLLDVSRFTQGKVTIRPEPVDLRLVVEAAVEASRPAIDEQEHTLELALPVEPLVVSGDAARLTQVVTNLLNNAAMYQEPKGTITVAVGTRDHDAIITVRDRGVGMSRELQDQVFEAFVQGERSHERPQTGLGVGLFLVRRLVELHGGTVTVSSEGPGQGAEFAVRLPYENGVANGEPATPATGRDAAQGDVLLVDDNIDAVETLAALLRVEGYSVHVAQDGQTALSLAGAVRPRAVLLDIGLPGMSGYEVCRRLRGAGMANVPMIALSGYVRDDADDDAALFDAWMVKPAPYGEVLQTLRTVMPSREVDHH